MKRYLFLILLAGCTAPAPEVAPSKPPTDGTAEVAAALVSLESKKAPAPAPKPGDVCPNCNGKKEVGDGTIMVPCKPCKGTGKVLPAEQPKPKAEPPEPQPRDVSKTPTNILLAEWNAWRHSPAARTREIQTVYETLLSRNVIRRDGEPVSDGGRRRIGRRR